MSSAITISDPTSADRLCVLSPTKYFKYSMKILTAALLHLLLEVNRPFGKGVCQKQNQIQNAYIFQGYINKLKQSVNQLNQSTIELETYFVEQDAVINAESDDLTDCNSLLEDSGTKRTLVEGHEHNVRELERLRSKTKLHSKIWNACISILTDLIQSGWEILADLEN